METAGALEFVKLSEMVLRLLVTGLLVTALDRIADWTEYGVEWARSVDGYTPGLVEPAVRSDEGRDNSVPAISVSVVAALLSGSITYLLGSLLVILIVLGSSLVGVTLQSQQFIRAVGAFAVIIGLSYASYDHDVINIKS